MTRDRAGRMLAALRGVALRVAAAVGLALWLTSGRAATEPPSTPEVIVTATALPGTAIDADKIPGNVQRLSAQDLGREGTASLTGALGSRLGGVNVGDNLDDPFQPDILYRGFAASPVLGTPQGLAVYQSGVRVNEAFGDAVNWDLIPDLAIERVSIVSSNPVYGLNALGGSVAVEMKNGFRYQGAEADVSAGAFAQHAANFQFGARRGDLAVYLAGKALDAGGWRDFSSDSVRQAYAGVAARSERATAELAYTYADNRLDGQGAAPLQELAINRSAVFTGPQGDRNRLDFLTLNGTYRASDTLSLQGVAYYRSYAQFIVNGNTTNYLACSAPLEAGVLCQPDGLTPLTGIDGRLLPDFSAGGSKPIGEDDAETIHASGSGVALQLSGTPRVLGSSHQFAGGASFDGSRVTFASSAQPGVIGPTLLVGASGVVIDTPETSPFTATPVGLLAENRYYGLYVTDTVDLPQRFALTASARYNVAQIDLRDRRGTSLTGTNRFSHVNPALGFAWKALATLTAYAGFSENTRTPTPSEIECANPLRPCLLPSNLASDPPTLRQVVAHTYEVGARGSAGASAARGDVAGRDGLSWSVGIFRTDVEDDIYGVATSVSSGFFRNIGATRRSGLELALEYRSGPWAFFVSCAEIDATFESAFLVASPLNPSRDAAGQIQVRAGDRLPGIPRRRAKLGIDRELPQGWTVGASLSLASAEYYHGDESNQNAPLAGYGVASVYARYRPRAWLELYGSIHNLFDARYATYGIYGDPTGVGAAGIPAGGATNGTGVDNRFVSPAAPLAALLGLRVKW